MKSDGSLRQLFQKNLPAVHWAVVETGATEPGVPDLNGCFRRREFWIECKLTSGWAIHFRPEQIGWITRRTRSGGRVFIAVRRRCEAGPRREAADEIYIFSGAVSISLSERGIGSVPPLAFYREGPKHWNWDGILDVML